MRALIRSLLLLMVVGTSLAGCSMDGSSAAPGTVAPSVAFDQIEVSGGADAEPEIALPSPLAVLTLQKRILTEGTGPKAAPGQRVTIDYVGVNGTDGEPFDTTYGKHAISFILDSTYNLDGLVNGLVGVPVGSRVLLAVPPDEAYGLEGLPAAGIGPTDTIVLVVDVRSTKEPLTRAAGTAVTPRAGLPGVKLAENGAPTITLPKGDPPTTLVVQPLIEGAGATVTRGQQITVRYTGIIWPGGKQFDSSWEQATPPSFTIGAGRVIGGWDRGLVGQTVGSQILLVIPPDDGYGAEGNPDAGIKGTDTLVFVVDILDAA